MSKKLVIQKFIFLKIRIYLFAKIFVMFIRNFIGLFRDYFSWYNMDIKSYSFTSLASISPTCSGTRISQNFASMPDSTAPTSNLKLPFKLIKISFIKCIQVDEQVVASWS